MRRKWFGIVTAHAEVLRMGPARLRHCLHDFSTQSSHSVDLTGWQAKMASIGIWVLWHNAHKPHFKESLWCTADMRHPATVYEAERSTQRLLKWPSLQCDLKRKELYPSSPPPCRKKSNGACAHYVMVITGIQNSVAAILAFHPALSTEWLDWVAKWYYDICTGPGPITFISRGQITKAKERIRSYVMVPYNPRPELHCLTWGLFCMGRCVHSIPSRQGKIFALCPT